MNTIHKTNELDKVTVGYGMAVVFAVIFNSVLAILKESYPPVLDFMKSVSFFGVKHHWLFHGLSVVILFYLLGWIFSKNETFSTDDSALTKTIAWATVLSALLVFGFFLNEMFA